MPARILSCVLAVTAMPALAKHGFAAPSLPAVDV
jgi:hypothetical protein